jgi:hypothetical protein
VSVREGAAARQAASCPLAALTACAASLCTPDTTNHTVVVYSTRDLATWTYLGEALPLAARPEPYIEFRPHVVFNLRLNQFVMWFESRTASDGNSEYAVALSSSPQGPFYTVEATVQLAGPGRVGDFDVFVGALACAMPVVPMGRWRAVDSAGWGGG